MVPEGGSYEGLYWGEGEGIKCSLVVKVLNGRLKR